MVYVAKFAINNIFNLIHPLKKIFSPEVVPTITYPLSNKALNTSYPLFLSFT